MWASEQTRRELVEKIAQKFRCFGGGKKSSWENPISKALENKPPQFAMGVDVREVVDFVLDKIHEKE